MNTRYKLAIGVGSVIVIAVIVGIVLGVVLTRDSNDGGEQEGRSFKIDFSANQFMLDGKPFRYVAGSFHYFRALPQTWREKLRTMRAGGLNAVDLYIQWSLHNPEDGVYNWQGIADVEHIVQIAKEEGLYVILRPGPYICAEIDNGGIPYWLAKKYPNIKVRTQDPDYLFEVERYYSKLMPQFEKHWYGNGGNIIMVQIENEYGAFKACDEVYKVFLRDETAKYTKDNALLFTCDRPIDDELTCGKVPDVFVTTDFGLANFTQVEFNFNKLREVQPTGPLVNTEFYTGWLTHWQEPNARRSGADLAQTLEYMLQLGANVDFYMYFGGTNFGFWAGANDWGIGSYMADITSYDYDAPMDEAGNPTEKFMIFRDVIKKYIPVVDESEIPSIKKTMTLPAITLTPVNSILSPEGRSTLGRRAIQSNTLLTFEELGQFSGFVLYETTLPSKFTRDPAILEVMDLRDRALVYVDGDFVGSLARENYIRKLPLSAGFEGSKLSILVENQGRINFQIADDYKGIRDRARVQTFHDTSATYETLTNWTITGYPFENVVELESLARISQNYQTDGNAASGPIVFHQTFNINEIEEINDTYWDTSAWGKGFLFINGFNLGRYWPVGPQITIYIPKDILKHGKNEVFVVELQNAPSTFRMNFVNGPIFINDEKV